MSIFARVIMRGSINATLFASISCMLPLTFWLGCAASALVILRAGVAQGLIVSLGALLGASVWYHLSGGETTAILAVITTTLAALGLRENNSWQWALSIIALVCAVNFQVLIYFSSTYLQSLADLYNSFGAQMQANVGAKQQGFALLNASKAAELVALMLAYVSALSLVLGRWWQAKLYNPGGFGDEFKALRLHPSLALALFVGAAFATYKQHIAWAGIISLPLLFAGVALVHAYTAQHKLAKHWLIFFYSSLFLLFSGVSMILTLLACADSQFNFRQRWQKTPSQ